MMKKNIIFIIAFPLIFMFFIGCIEITPRYTNDSQEDEVGTDNNHNEEQNDDESNDEGSNEIIETTLSDYLKNEEKYAGSKISFHAWFKTIEDDVIFVENTVTDESYRFSLPKWLNKSIFVPKNPDGYIWIGKPIRLYPLHMELNNYRLCDGNQPYISIEEILFNPESFDGEYITIKGIVNIVASVDNLVAITDEEQKYYDIYLEIPNSIDISEFSEGEEYYFSGKVNIEYNSWSISYNLIDVIPK